jgi:hypothetical protein
LSIATPDPRVPGRHMAGFVGLPKYVFLDFTPSWNGARFFCGAKCRDWPIASFRGDAAFGRFGGYSDRSGGSAHRPQFMYAR